MKTFLYDMTNFGIIYVNDLETQRTPWEVTMFKSCILDIGGSRINGTSPHYANLSNAALDSTFYVINQSPTADLNERVDLGDNQQRNPIFEEKRKRARLIGPLIRTLSMALTKKSLSKLNTVVVPMDDTIAHELSKSNPATGTYSVGVVEYAKMLDITPSQAYTELELEYQTAHSIKMRAYAASKKYVTLIREVDTQEKATALLAEMEQKLLKETYI